MITQRQVDQAYSDLKQQTEALGKTTLAFCIWKRSIASREKRLSTRLHSVGTTMESTGSISTKNAEISISSI
jgi:hypothetical protein